MMWAAATTYLRSYIAAWTSQLTLFLIGAVLSLIGVFYLISSAQSWLAVRFPEHIAGLMIAGSFLFLGVAVIVIAKIKGHKPKSTALATVAMSAALGSSAQLRSPALVLGQRVLKLAKPILGFSGAGLVVLGTVLKSRIFNPKVEILPPELRERLSSARMSSADAAGELAGALGRDIKSGAAAVSATWRDMEPGLREKGRAAQRALAGAGGHMASHVADVLRKRPRRSLAATFLPRRMEAALPQLFSRRRPARSKSMLAYGLSTVAVLALAAALIRSDDRTR